MKPGEEQIDDLLRALYNFTPLLAKTPSLASGNGQLTLHQLSSYFPRSWIHRWTHHGPWQGFRPLLGPREFTVWADIASTPRRKPTSDPISRGAQSAKTARCLVWFSGKCPRTRQPCSLHSTTPGDDRCGPCLAPPVNVRVGSSPALWLVNAACGGSY